MFWIKKTGDRWFDRGVRLVLREFIWERVEQAAIREDCVPSCHTRGTRRSSRSGFFSTVLTRKIDQMPDERWCWTQRRVANATVSKVDSRDLQTSNISIWRYHCLGEVPFLKIWNQYWLPSDTVYQRYLFISPVHLQTDISLESTLANFKFQYVI